MEKRSYSLKAIAAMASNRVIGRGGQLPWHLPEDLRLFKKLTLGSPILMGRKTFESIGKALPGRRNIVLSRTWNPTETSGFELIRDINDIDSLGLKGEVFVIGGAEIYTALLPRCDEILLSFVYEPHEGDTRFPEFEHDFELVEVIASFADFELRRYRRRAAR